jgi:membrane-associated phospholipid phosphatase
MASRSRSSSKGGLVGGQFANRRAAWLLLGGALPALVFGALAYHATRPRTPQSLGWDLVLVRDAHHLGALQPLGDLALSFSDLGGLVDRSVLTGLLAAVLLLLAFRRTTHAVFGGVILAGVLLNPLLQQAFERSPPEQQPTPGHYAFPSGLAFAAAACFGWLTIACWHSVWRWPLLVLGAATSLLIALQAVFSGEHWPSDVVAGWCLAALALTLAHLVRRRLGGGRLPGPPGPQFSDR